MAGSTVRVLIADDHEPLRRFVSSTLARLPRLMLVGEASDGLEALRKVRELQVDIILLDISLPKLNGFEVARRIRERIPQLRILFFSTDCSSQIAEEALRLGAGGYIVKSDAGTELLPALEAVLHGETYLSSSLTNRALFDPYQKAHERGS
jgi:DNA-binding NarL/FixJ family response regulator